MCSHRLGCVSILIPSSIPCTCFATGVRCTLYHLTRRCISVYSISISLRVINGTLILSSGRGVVSSLMNALISASTSTRSGNRINRPRTTGQPIITATRSVAILPSASTMYSLNPARLLGRRYTVNALSYDLNAHRYISLNTSEHRPTTAYKLVSFTSCIIRLYASTLLVSGRSVSMSASLLMSYTLASCTASLCVTSLPTSTLRVGASRITICLPVNSVILLSRIFYLSLICRVSYPILRSRVIV